MAIVLSINWHDKQFDLSPLVRKSIYVSYIMRNHVYWLYISIFDNLELTAILYTNKSRNTIVDKYISVKNKHYSKVHKV